MGFGSYFKGIPRSYENSIKKCNHNPIFVLSNHKILIPTKYRSGDS